jgi:PadR family transcriptional regulator PadR
VIDGAWHSWTYAWLVPFLLLSMRDGELHGHELLKGLDELGFGETRPGKVYRTLRLLEGKGLTFAERESTEYLLSHHTYRITETGEAYLESLAHSLERYRKEIELFFLLYEEKPVHEVRR